MNFDIFSNLFTNIWSIFLVILTFGGSIFVHELGHFLAAKRRGLKIERFSIGFGPKILGWKKNGVDYRISLIPLGGYVALPQLADMGAIEGKSQNVKQLPAISYSDKMIVAAMGAVFNFIFAFILATILWQIGQPSSREQLTSTIGYVAKTIHLDIGHEAAGPAYKAGLLPGDKVLKLDGSRVSDFNELQQLIVTGTGRTPEGAPQAVFTIERAGQILEIPVQPELVQINQASGDSMRQVGISPEQLLKLDTPLKNSPAQKAGLQKNDTIVAANGIKLYSLKMLSDIVNQSPENEVLLTIDRKNKLYELVLQAEQVPYTKSMGLFTALTDENAIVSLKVLPIFPKEVTQNLTDPKNPSQLMVFDVPANHYFEGIETGDILVAINQHSLTSLQDFLETIDSNAKEKMIALSLTRNATSYQKTFSPKNVTASIIPPLTQSLLGVQLQAQPIIIHVDPITQFKDNISMTFRTLGSLFHKGSDLSVSNLMGPPGIIRVLHTFSVHDIRLLIWFVVLLNINLAILNLLPIPVLDGGHIAFATIAKLTGKPLPQSFIQTVQGTFMILLFGLMFYVSFFDVRRWQGDQALENKLKLQQNLYIPAKFPQE